MNHFNYFINNPPIFYLYLNELKLRFLYCCLTIIISSIICYIYSDQIIYILTNNLLSNMKSHRFIFTTLTEIFFTYIKFSIITGVLISWPFIIFQIWLFLLPGLYKFEKLILDFFILISLISFIFSIIINYYIILPNILKFFLNFENNNNFFPLHFEAKLENYLLFTLKLFANIILCFQFPFIICILLFFNVISYKFFINNRKIFYIIFLFLSAIIAPPDVYSQLLIFFLLSILYELILYLFIFYKYFI